MDTDADTDALTDTHRITAIYCWIATYEDGSEGIIGGNITGTPLLSSRRHVAENMEVSARQAMRLTQHTKHPVRSVRMAMFRVVA